jgi:glutamine amidotransferase
MKVAVIKYNGGNTRSVAFALERLGIDFMVTDDHEEIQKADKVLFPGVGEAKSTMDYLRSRNLDKIIQKLTQPVLGICLGMQLLCSHSEENDTPGLGIFDLEVKKFIPDNHLKIPHTGWNNLTNVKGWLGTQFENKFVYFVHSYYVPPGVHTAAECEYGIRFSAALQRENFYAVQFHPEKSSTTGQRVLQQFLQL